MGNFLVKAAGNEEFELIPTDGPLDLAIKDQVMPSRHEGTNPFPQMRLFRTLQEKRRSECSLPSVLPLDPASFRPPLFRGWEKDGWKRGTEMKALLYCIYKWIIY